VERQRLDGVQHLGRDADIRDVDLTAMCLAGHEQVPRLETKKRDRPAGADGGATDLPRPSVDAAREVHGHDRAPGPVDPLDGCGCLPIEISAQARPEQRIDDDASRSERIAAQRIQGLDNPPIGARRKRGVAGELVRRSEEKETDVAAGALQFCRCDEAVAAVVSRPCDHRDISRAGHARRCVRDRLAGTFHESEPVRTSGDRQPVSVDHFSRREELNELSGWRSHRQLPLF
jgi:hypothetical protein